MENAEQFAAEMKRDEQSEKQSKEGHELEADSAHPSPVQGSDGGRAQGETASEDPAPTKTKK
jgi:hypothetical protein